MFHAISSMIIFLILCCLQDTLCSLLMVQKGEDKLPKRLLNAATGKETLQKKTEAAGAETESVNIEVDDCLRNEDWSAGHNRYNFQYAVEVPEQTKRSLKQKWATSRETMKPLDPPNGH